MPASIPYKSFCWSFGTTSFRTKNFNKTYKELYPIFEEAFNSVLPPHMWYDNCLKNTL